MTTTTTAIVTDVLTHAVAVSGNEKLVGRRDGSPKIAATMRDRNSCGPCVLWESCYAKGRIEGTPIKFGTTTPKWVVTVLGSRAAMLRGTVVGDLLNVDGDLDLAYVAGLWVIHELREDIAQMHFTHTWPREDVTPDLLPGTLNASCETGEDILVATAMGFPTVLAAATWEEAQEIGARVGMPVTLCANTRNKAIGCADCRLCWKSSRRATVVFTMHGSSAKRGTEAVRALNTI